MKLPPPLESKTVMIRPFVIDDAESVNLFTSDPEVMRYLPGDIQNLEETTQGTKSHIEYCKRDELDSFTLAVVAKTNKKVVGWVGLAPLKESGDVEIFYAIARESWGHGYASEATGLLLNHAFRVMGIDEIVAIINPENIASHRVAEKNGMTFDRLVTDPRFSHEEKMYSIRMAQPASRPYLDNARF